MVVKSALATLTLGLYRLAAQLHYSADNRKFLSATFELNRLLNGFEGKLNSSKWAAIAKCSTDTAVRDIDDLIKRGILAKDVAGGRSTSYSLIDPAAISIQPKAL